MSSSSVSRTVDDAGESGEGRSRKRKRSTKEHDAAASSSTPPPPPPPPQHSAPTLPDTIRGKPLEPSSLAYFRSLHSSLQAAADSGTDVQLMVAAAFGELKGLEYRLLVNKHGSRCVEALIAHSTPSQLSTLLSATQSAAFALLIDRNASHPMQQLIERLPRLLLDEQRAGKQDEAGSLSSSLLAFCQSLAEPPTPEQSAAAASQLSAPPASCWPLLMMQEQGSYAVRSLARLMSGAIDIGGQADKERRPAGPSGAAGSVPPSSVSHVSFLRPVLSALVDSVVGLKEADRIELAFHATAAPALSELLATLSGHPHYHSLLESLLLSMLLTDDDRSQSEAVSVSSRGVSHAAQMMRHRAGSHLFEHILRATRQLPATPTGSTGAAAARLTFATLVRDTLQGDMAELAVHSTGNHVLQTALTLCTHNEQHFVKKACTTLGAMCQRLIGQPAAHTILPVHFATTHCAHICHRKSAIPCCPPAMSTQIAGCLYRKQTFSRLNRQWFSRCRKTANNFSSPLILPRPAATAYQSTLIRCHRHCFTDTVGYVLVDYVLCHVRVEPCRCDMAAASGLSIRVTEAARSTRRSVATVTTGRRRQAVTACTAHYQPQPSHSNNRRRTGHGRH